MLKSFSLLGTTSSNITRRYAVSQTCRVRAINSCNSANLLSNPMSNVTLVFQGENQCVGSIQQVFRTFQKSPIQLFHISFVLWALAAGTTTNVPNNPFDQLLQVGFLPPAWQSKRDRQIGAQLKNFANAVLN